MAESQIFIHRQEGGEQHGSVEGTGGTGARAPSFSRQAQTPNRGPSATNNGPTLARVFVSNIPLDVGWQELKDLFKSQVGLVSHVDLFKDKDDQVRNHSYFISDFGIF